MVIFKILNNNAIVIRDENKREQIAMGRGLAYKKKPGDFVASSQIEKIYTLSSPDVSDRFQELMKDIPMDVIELADKFITYSKTKLAKRLNDVIYVSLVDHLHTAIERFRSGIEVKNVLLWDIKIFYADEFYLGEKALEMIKEAYGLELPLDEAGFIALHLVNAELNDSIQNTYEMTKVIQEIISIVKYYFNLTFDENSVYYYRFITHLKFFSHRLLTGRTMKEQEQEDLLDIVRQKYKNAYSCAGKISDFILKKYKYTVSDEEILYLTVHIERIVYKNEN